MIATRHYPVKIKQIPGNRKPGKISKDRPHERELHEIKTAEILARFGYDIQFICTSNISHVSTPDCLWQNDFWEMKFTRSGRSIEQAVGDIIGYINRRKNTRIQKVLILDQEKYCFFDKNDILS